MWFSMEFMFNWTSYSYLWNALLWNFKFWNERTAIQEQENGKEKMLKENPLILWLFLQTQRKGKTLFFLSTKFKFFAWWKLNRHFKKL